MYKVALIGNPNTGKSTLFNAITGANAKIANWHGVTVAAQSKSCVLEKSVETQFVDLPGVYSLTPYSLEEKIVTDFIDHEKCDLILSIVESRNFYRSISLTLALIEKGLNVALVLTMADELEKNGGKIDKTVLSETLHVPVFSVNGNSKSSVKMLKKQLAELLLSDKKSNNTKTAVHITARDIPQSAVNIPVKTTLSIADKFFLNKFFAPFLYLGVLGVIFYVAFGRNCLGDYSVRLLDWLISEKLGGVVGVWLSDSPPFLSSLVSDGIIGGLGKVLTFIPQLIILYMSLFLLEESGLMSRLAFMTDGFFKKVGLNGRAAFSIAMGFGCTAVGAMTTRGLNDCNLQKKAIISLPFITCGAKLPVYLVILGAYKLRLNFLILILIYVSGMALSLISAAVLDKTAFKGEETQFIMELPPYRKPPFKRAMKTLLECSKNFLLRIGGIIFLVMLALWFLQNFSFSFKYLGMSGYENSILGAAGAVLKYLFYPIGIKDSRIAVSMLAGLFAKESVAGCLSIFFPTGISQVVTLQSAAALISFIAFYTPCFSALAAMRREVGFKITLQSALFQFFFALTLSYLTYFVYGVIMLIGFYVWFIVLAALIIGVLAWIIIPELIKKRRLKKSTTPLKGKNERIHMFKKRKTFKVSRR